MVGGAPLEPIQHSGPVSSTAYREQPSDWILRLDQQQALRRCCRLTPEHSAVISYPTPSPQPFFFFADKLFKLLKAPVFLGPPGNKFPGV